MGLYEVYITNNLNIDDIPVTYIPTSGLVGNKIVPPRYATF